MVENLDPFSLGKGVCEQRCKQGPGVHLGAPAHISKELVDSGLLNAQKLLNWLQDGQRLRRVMLKPDLHPLTDERHDYLEDKQVVVRDQLDEGKYD